MCIFLTYALVIDVCKKKVQILIFFQHIPAKRKWFNNILIIPFKFVVKLGFLLLKCGFCWFCFYTGKCREVYCPIFWVNEQIVLCYVLNHTLFSGARHKWKGFSGETYMLYVQRGYLRNSLCSYKSLLASHHGIHSVIYKTVRLLTF